ncbi:MAG: AraC family transcriptional regulator [Clostridiales bacterium]|nr:AraC family transcriptional regulator [Clostridiales bacterium]
MIFENTERDVYYEERSSRMRSKIFTFDFAVDSKNNKPLLFGKNFWTIQPHYHSKLELIYILKGSMRMLVNSGVFDVNEGDLFAINPSEIHAAYICREHPHVEYIFIGIDLMECQLIDEKVLKDLMDRHCVLQRTNYKPEFANQIGRYMTTFYELNAKSDNNPGIKLEMKAISLSIISKFIQNDYIDYSIIQTSSSDNFVLKAINFIENNYSHQITSAEIKKEFSYNYSYFCRLFKKNFFTPFSVYLCEYRICKAVEEISESASEHIKISEISSRVGFTDYCYFSSCFKKYVNMPPSEYAKQVRKKK